MSYIGRLAILSTGRGSGGGMGSSSDWDIERTCGPRVRAERGPRTTASTGPARTYAASRQRRDALGQQVVEAVGVDLVQELGVGWAIGDAPPVGHGHAEG